MRKVNLIPMAGVGQRFIDAGLTIPKPLIEINGIPMVVNAANSLPKADIWIFVCNDKHISDYKIDKTLARFFSNAIIISVDHVTEGQASTCLLAKEYLRVDDALTVGACDNGMVYDKQALNSYESGCDVVVWTFRNNKSVIENPKMYGYVEVNDLGFANRVSCKTPISEKPENDHAIVGTFSFNKASYFINNAEAMIAKNRRVNNEFYVDIVIDECIESSLMVKPFEVEQYYCWGTPFDLKRYLDAQSI